MMAIDYHQFIGRSDGPCRLCGEHLDTPQHRTATGRQPSTEPNLQNIPVRSELGREIREAITPLPKAKASADYTEAEKRIAEGLDEEKEWVCADCGREYAEGHLCRYCGSVRVVLKSVVADLFGPDWRKAFE
jgi:DNA-directed RNA polymerase subunit RPC12/RpoP